MVPVQGKRAGNAAPHACADPRPECDAPAGPVQFDLHEGRLSAGDASLYAAPNDATDFATTDLSWDAQVSSLLAAYERVLVKKHTGGTAARKPR